ncbi:MAG: 23S rRNA (uracil(1939)-C(5))-methyltransferase RlmD [Geobacter sp.]|nr:23S rRNA (uracil(1939)-C(5))-methyltransferase RlmD [Geobacter sp.]
MSLHELTIDRLALGGSGVGRLNGKVCFVPFSAPGDGLKVRIEREHRSYCEAELVELVEPSPVRTAPVCPVFGQCGGCSLQHISYDEQCRAKQQQLYETLQRIAKIADPPVSATVAAADQYGYRARAQFKLHNTLQGLAVGFYRRGSRFVIDLPHGCPVVTPAINQAISRLRSILQQVPDRDRIPQVSLEEGIDGVVAIIHYIGADAAALVERLLAGRDQLELAGLFLQTGRKDSLQQVYGSGVLQYAVPACGADGTDLQLQYGIGGFSQVNRQQNRTMISLVCSAAQPAGNHRLLDLFCGNGNLSLPMAAHLQDLYGVEGFAPSLASAVDNAGQLHVNNSTFNCLSAESAVVELLQVKAQFDTVVLDPPRAGAAELMRMLPRLAAERIIYVSCDPATLARDLAILCGGTGYCLVQATPLDMFPQTGHLETVALLQQDR